MDDRKETPIILADASSLRDLADIHLQSDELELHQGAGQFDITELIDKLAISGNRTIMMPGTILTELFPTLSGRLTLDTNAAGHVTFPLGVHHNMFPHADQPLMYQYFSDLAQKGLLRCYDSPEEMLKAGEVNHPKGGLVFVHMNEPLADQGRKYEEDKVDLVLGLSSKRQDRKKFKDQGDKDICELSKIIEEHTQQSGNPVKTLLLNADDGLRKRFNREAVSESVHNVKPLTLVYSMVSAGMIDKNTERAVENSIITLGETDKIFEKIADQLGTNEGRANLRANEEVIASWLEATAPSDDAGKKTR